MLRFSVFFCTFLPLSTRALSSTYVKPIYVNHTIFTNPLPTTGSCSGCSYLLDEFEIGWGAVTTHTAATVIVGVHNASNATAILSTVQGSTLPPQEGAYIGGTVLTTVVGQTTYTITSPTSRFGIDYVWSTDVFEVTNSAGSVQCVTSTTDFEVEMLFDVKPGTASVGYPEQLSSLINLSRNCSEGAMSPPDFLIPVAALTATSTTHVANLPSTSPAPASSPLVRVPTMTSGTQSFTLSPLLKGPDTSVGSNPGSSPTHDLPISSTGTFEIIDTSQTEANAVRIPISQGGPREGFQNPQVTSDSAITTTPAPQEFPDITIASQTYHPTTFPVLTLSGSVVLPSAPIKISGTPFILQPGGSTLIIGSKTLPVPTPNKLLILGSNTITVNSASAFTLEGQTLVPGSPAITVSGTTISINSQASKAVTNGITSSLPPAASSVIVDGHTLTPGLASGYNIGDSSALLAGGQAVTINSTPYSLALGGTTLIVAGSSTQILSSIPKLASPTPKLLTFASSTYTPNSASQYIIGGQTLQPGSAITVSGTPITLAADATRVVVGSSTETLTQNSTPLASVIMAGFGSQASGKNVSGSGNSSVVVFAGAGNDKSVAQSLAMCMVGMAVGVVMIY